ncbi:MAG: hypothetical protein LAQ69_48890 [Acidobacteriia bacterium]|nr:hypothetical protein [Terriglobia bacterium]
MTLPPADPNLEEQVTDKPPLRDDTHFASGKIAVFQYVTVGIFLFLISGFWALQVQNPQFYDERAQQNRIKSVPVLAPRGRILDRDGRVIVDNHASFSLILARESLKEEHLRPIAQGLDLDYSDLAAQVRKVKLEPKYVPIVVKQELTPGDLAFVDSHHDFFPELVLIPSQRRLYPQNGMMAHVIGYTGQVSEKELGPGQTRPQSLSGRLWSDRSVHTHALVREQATDPSICLSLHFITETPLVLTELLRVEIEASLEV